MVYPVSCDRLRSCRDMLNRLALWSTHQCPATGCVPAENMLKHPFDLTPVNDLGHYYCCTSAASSPAYESQRTPPVPGDQALLEQASSTRSPPESAAGATRSLLSGHRPRRSGDATLLASSLPPLCLRCRGVPSAKCQNGRSLRMAGRWHLEM